MFFRNLPTTGNERPFQAPDPMPLRGRVITGKKRQRRGSGPPKESVYAQIGDAVHRMVQSEFAVRGNLFAAEAALIDVKNRFTGRIDVLTASGETVEIKSVSLSELLSLTGPKPEHKLQLGYYLGATGASSGTLLYVAREAPYVRKTFKVQASDELYELGKAYMLARREGDLSESAFVQSTFSALDDQKSPAFLAQDYLSAVNDYKKFQGRLWNQQSALSTKQSITMARAGGDKESSLQMPGLIPDSFAAAYRKIFTPFGSPSKFSFTDPYFKSILENNASPGSLSSLEVVDLVSRYSESQEQVQKQVSKTYRKKILSLLEREKTVQSELGIVNRKIRQIQKTGQISSGLSKEILESNAFSLGNRLSRIRDQIGRITYKELSQILPAGDSSSYTHSQLVKDLDVAIRDPKPLPGAPLSSGAVPKSGIPTPSAPGLNAAIRGIKGSPLDRRFKPLVIPQHIDPSTGAQVSERLHQGNLQAKQIRDKGLSAGIMNKGRVAPSGPSRTPSITNPMYSNEIFFDIETGINKDLSLEKKGVSGRIWEISTVHRRMDAANVTAETLEESYKNVQAKHWRAYDLAPEAREALYQAKTTDDLLRKGLIGKGDVDLFKEMGRKAGFTTGESYIKFLQEDMRAYDKVSRANAGAEVKYGKIESLVKMKQMKQVTDLTSFYKSEKQMLQGFFDYVGGMQQKVGNEAFALWGHNIKRFDIAGTIARAKVLGVQADFDAIYRHTEDTLQNEVASKWHEAQENFAFREVPEEQLKQMRNLGFKENMARRATKTNLKLAEFHPALGITNEALVGLAHGSNYDVLANMFSADIIRYSKNLPELAGYAKAITLAEEGGDKETVRQLRYKAGQRAKGIGGITSLEDFARAKNFTSADEMFVSFSKEAAESVKVGGVGIQGASLGKTIGEGFDRVAKAGIDLVAGAGEYEGAKGILKSAGTVVDDLFAGPMGAIRNAADAFHNAIKPGEKLTIGKGRAGLMAVGALAAGLVGVMAFGKDPAEQFPTVPRTPPPMRKVPLPSGDDGNYTIDVEFEGQAQEIRRRMTDFGSAYRGMHGSALAAIQSMITRPNLSVVTKPTLASLKNVLSKGAKLQEGSLSNQVQTHITGAASLGQGRSLTSSIAFDSSFTQKPLHRNPRAYQDQIGRKIRFNLISSQGTRPFFESLERSRGHTRSMARAVNPV